MSRANVSFFVENGIHPLIKILPGNGGINLTIQVDNNSKQKRKNVKKSKKRTKTSTPKISPEVEIYEPEYANRDVLYEGDDSVSLLVEYITWCGHPPLNRCVEGNVFKELMKFRKDAMMTYGDDLESLVKGFCLNQPGGRNVMRDLISRTPLTGLGLSVSVVGLCAVAASYWGRLNASHITDVLVIMNENIGYGTYDDLFYLLKSKLEDNTRLKQ